ncbi:class I SAM-dependent methyltransferase [Prochlorococcus sp. MIT 1300]|uniref:class I SAM-dependent methyltransferase n=1 Tax=Prochlorococcus sp. MIT 1300 TaxID=3096218 RepID=UPI002A75F67E|nr:class I SAM-dependent methyltransferase [Prochlorococcus sp. MIT 1300]
MSEVDFMSVLHKSTNRDYLGRVNDPIYPKEKAAELAKRWGFDYWDGDRRICYGGYQYIEGRWEKVARQMSSYFKLPKHPKILDIGCGKGYLLYDWLKVIPDAEVHGLDISSYAIEHAKEEVKDNIKLGNATKLPWKDNYFDLVISINTLHCLYSYELEKALKEIERVGNNYKYICVESYRNEKEKANLLYWQLTCEAFHTPKEWLWWFENTGYTGDHSFIYFE